MFWHIVEYFWLYDDVIIHPLITIDIVYAPIFCIFIPLMKQKLFILFLFILHVGLSVFHLNQTPMWDDEASVVWFAKNYNEYGKIVGYDGENIFSYRNGQLINNELVYNNPPLDIYFTSYIIKWVGDDDFTIRMSFALVGMLALVFYLLIFKMIANKDNKWFLYSSVLLLLSVNYLLIEGNSRYYSLTFLFGAISLFISFLIVKKPERNMLSKILLIVIQLVSIYFLFLSHYLAAMCWWLMVFFVLWQHKQFKFSFKDKFSIITVLLNLVLLVFIVRYIIAENALSRPDMSNDDSFFLKYFKLFGWLWNDLNRLNIIPLWSIPLLIFLMVARKKIISIDFKKMIFFSLLFLGASFLLNPQSTSKSTCFDVRYIYVILPILYMVMGYLLKLVHENFKLGKFVSITMLLLLINTTWLFYIPESTPPRLLLPNFIKERVEPYPTAYTEVLKYIDAHFNGRKKILTIPGYHNTVLLRYVPDKIEITNTLDVTTPLSKAVVDSLGMQCLYIGNCKPEYIFQFGTEDKLNAYPYKPSDYKYIDTIPVYAFGIDVTRPELFWHSFGPMKIKDINKEALYIYHD